jgi:hypothetical protein
MTSDDTHQRTVDLLAANGNFGMAEGQVCTRRTQNTVGAAVPSTGTHPPAPAPHPPPPPSPLPPVGGCPWVQIILMKQEKVAALLDNDAHIAMVSPYEMDTKPHGHGDVHTLLCSTGLVAKWAAEGRRYVLFFQDTNALCFMTAVASIGFSARENLEVNSICVPRMAGEAVGAIARLEHTDGSSITCNVEYNQLAPLLKCVPLVPPQSC